jgi:hypothetical protein
MLPTLSTSTKRHRIVYMVRLSLMQRVEHMMHEIACKKICCSEQAQVLIVAYDNIQDKILNHLKHIAGGRIIW